MCRYSCYRKRRIPPDAGNVLKLLSVGGVVAVHVTYRGKASRIYGHAVASFIPALTGRCYFTSTPVRQDSLSATGHMEYGYLPVASFVTAAAVAQLRIT